MTDYAFPTPDHTMPAQPNTEASDIHFDRDENGRTTAVTIKLGDHDCAILGLDDGWIRIADISRDRLCAREAIFLAWALSVLAADEETRW